MKCINPRRLPNPTAAGVYDAYMLVGCGKCYGCLANRRRSWLFRLKQETIDSIKSYFCTFTYNDENSDGFLHKKHMQDYFKRLRSVEDFTYYCIGEYGTHTLRPHYHAVIFFKSLGDEDIRMLLTDKWPYGFVRVGICSYRRLNYILHYHTRPKKLDDSHETFQLFSKRLGLGFLNDDIIKWMCDTKQFVIKSYDGGCYVIPRYYRKKLVDAGYDLDPSERVFDSDYSRDRLEKVFNKPIYLITEDEKVQFLHDIKNISMQKVNKYNHQDKF